MDEADPRATGRDGHERRQLLPLAGGVRRAVLALVKAGSDVDSFTCG